MGYKIAICDDRNEDAKYIASVVSKWAAKEKIPMSLETFPSAESFLFQYAEQKDYDIQQQDIVISMQSKRITISCCWILKCSP